MKITSVDVIKTNAGTAPVEGTHWNPICVRVNTDEGISGFGEAGVAYTSGGDAAFGMIKDFAKLVIGMDPMQNEAIWNKMHRDTFWGSGGGTIVFSAMAAIDIALWDIKGKALGVPVYQLLGGKTNDHLRTYASQIQFDWDIKATPMITPEDYARATKKAMAEGYTAIKVDPLGFDEEGNWDFMANYGLLEHHQIKKAVDRVAAIREAGGDDLDIIVELHSLTDTNTAIQLGRELEKFKIFYYEEPTQPLNPRLYKEISRKVNIPLATGERSYSRWGYRQFFEDRTVSIIQPDICNTGGLTEAKKICDMALTYDVGVQIHVCGGPISTAAALQLEAAIPNFVIHEHHQTALMQGNIDLCKYNYQPKNGFFEVPERPGIGQELTDETIANAEVFTVK
ncbi:mandelate racemase/muconate lactonizing enzyme family protein [Streptococcus pacificus]|uniref:Mandelate racemase/muconate lactonizing enzyme family protein n=1 Tax=Streptococcus pacificus TaxID=2740577 RepID=A0ABS0ZJS6_9STRE|nr:mandelate racemase/muconate lactonizing enzyme family protein [Streptococcus pacificus]MBJ8326211.1 mandelate racemase/muconate lactonizing enzyme family protein [Streptococcus pacificus]